MKLNSFYMVTMPISVAKILMKRNGDKGNPETLVMKVPTADFSHESYDEFLYNKGIFNVFSNLLFNGDITVEQFRELRIYEVVEMNGKQVKKDLAKYQDFLNSTIYGCN